MTTPGGTVQYDYAGIAAVTGQLTSCKTEAESLLHTGTMHRTQLAAAWQGISQMSFDDAYQKFNSVQQSTIDTCQATINAITHGTDNFQAGEGHAAAAY